MADDVAGSVPEASGADEVTDSVPEASGVDVPAMASEPVAAEPIVSSEPLVSSQPLVEPTSVLPTTEATSAPEPLPKVPLVLTVLRPTGAPQTFTLKMGTQVRIGRGTSADVALDVAGISSRHAELVLESDSNGSPMLMVRDNSRNGTGVRARPLTAGGPKTPWKRLQKGESCSIGHNWQIKVPLKSRKGETIATQTPEALRTLTLHVASAPTESPVVHKSATGAAMWAAPPPPVVSEEKFLAGADAKRKKAAMALGNDAEREEAERKKREKKEKKKAKKTGQPPGIGFPGVDAASVPAPGAPAALAATAAATQQEQGRWRRRTPKLGTEGGVAGDMTAAEINASIDAEIGLPGGGLTGDVSDMSGDEVAAPGGKVQATRPKQRAKSSSGRVGGNGLVDSSPEHAAPVALPPASCVCGNTFADGSLFCGMCGAKRPHAKLPLSGAAAAVAAEKEAAIGQWRHGQAGGGPIRLTETALNAASSAAADAHRRIRAAPPVRLAEQEAEQSFFLGASVIRDMSVSPISAPGVGRKKKKRKHQPGQDSDSGMADGKKKKKHRKNVGAPQTMAPGGIDPHRASLRPANTAASPPRRRLKENDPERWAPSATPGMAPRMKTKDPEKKKAKKRSVSPRKKAAAKEGKERRRAA